mmetsp:Transcript_20637/g.25523  ORF Transcript_20637/g.25523 Transcript_20637/m.25523 type:complete len:102 (+) Transcript_20637:195-500(+)
MCNDLGATSRCCAFYSATGIIFTLWVGIMITLQPFFIAGIEDVETAKSSSFGAMGMFIFTFVASIFGIYHDSKQKQEEIENPEGYQLNQGNQTGYGASRFE